MTPARLRRADSVPLLSAAVFALGACSAAMEPAYAQPIAAHGDAPIEIISPEEMRANTIVFPDTPMTFLRRENGEYTVFAGGVPRPDIRGSARPKAGTYVFVGDADHLRPSGSPLDALEPALTDGRLQPLGDGSDFDRDYAGGGQVIVGPGGDLYQFYHGEFHCQPPRGLPAIGTLGVAVSHDAGRRFEKLGPLLSPHVTRETACKSAGNKGYWADGAMIEADGSGRPLQAGERTDRYDYMLFVDHNAVDEHFIGVSIARARKNDVDDALKNLAAPKFRKYLRPETAAGDEGAFFTEPALGGSSTPLIADNFVFIGTPGVVFDPELAKFILYYQYNQTHIALRFGDDLFHWSTPTDIVALPAGSDWRLFYPTLVGLGRDPVEPGRRFYMYFMERRSGNIEQKLMRTTVTVP